MNNYPIQSLKRIWNFAIVLVISLTWNIVKVEAQTDFAPGEIMFTGYDSDNPDAFSIVVLKDVTAGTIIYITDRGWSSTTGFRDDNNGEGTISFEFTEDYPCGTSVVFLDLDPWAAFDAYGTPMGTVTILTSTTESPDQDPQGIEFNSGFGFPPPDGDQLFVYQLPEPNPGDMSGFVTGMHMNGGPWNGDNNNDYNSQKPSGLADNEVVRFNTEVDNAKYDCTPNLGDGGTLQAAITNDNGGGTLIADGSNNWQESNNYINLLPACIFCCGNTAPEAAPVLSGPSFVAPDEIFQIDITGTLGSGESWELYTAGCGVGAPLQTTMSSSFTITAPSTEQTITYFIRTSEIVDCEAICATITIDICDVFNNQNICSDCSADMTECGDCYLPPPADNPNLDSGCYAIRLIFVLDESGSIGNNDVDVADGVLAFLNAINGQDAEAAIIEFSGTATLVNDYTVVNQAYIDNIDAYFNGGGYNGQNYNPGGGTNWHDAMIEVDALGVADLVLFFTDGVPTVWGTGGNTCGNGATTQPPEIVNPVKLANKVKGEGAHMFMLGVGNGVVESNLQAMSGLDEYVEGNNTLGTSDYSIGNFEDLAQDLEDFIFELCQTTIIIRKEVLGPICNGQVDFRFTIINIGTESAASVTYAMDTLPSGYDNPVFNGDPTIKVCFGADCSPPLFDNTMLWIPGTIPPGDSVSITITVDVLPTGEYTNIAWAYADNSNITSDTFPGDLLTEDLPPTITCPANITIQCDESTLPDVTGNPTGINPDGPDPTFTYTDSEVSGACPQELTITRTWTATDNCSNIATCEQIIEIIDTTPPVITCPADVTIDCSEDTSPNLWGTASASDLCDFVPAVTFTDEVVPGSCIPESTVLRTWVAEDACGNTSSCVQSIFLKDNTPPSLICAMNVTIGCEDSTLPANTGVTTMKPQNCGGTGFVTYEDEYVIQDGAPQCSIIRTWTGTDDCGNSSTCVQTIEVVDNVTPTLTCPPNITLSCSDGTLPGDTGLGTAVDNCDVAPVVTYSDDIPAPTCEHQYIINRTWIASDECGNNTSCVQVISISDLVAPELTCPPNITIECTDDTLPGSTGSATASDNCSGVIDIAYLDVTTESTECVQEYTITRTWMATDICGNVGTCVQMIFIDDSTSPVITCPANVTISCTDVTLPENTGLATAIDNCDAAPVVTYADLTSSLPSCAQEYTITRTWTATDACGNLSTCEQVITIDDSTPPVITCPADITIACTDSTLPAETGEASATDNCDVNPVVTYLDDITNGGCAQEYTITRTWTATDACGNFSTCNQVLVIIDEVSPVITCPADITIECTESTLPENTGSATALDNCDTTPDIAFSDVTMTSPTCIQEYTITRTWTATDACGNSSTCVQTIIVDDSTSPVITCPANVTIECTENTLPENTGEATASDNCDAVPDITFSDVTTASPECAQEYSITRTWMATDDCGNTSTCVQTIFIDDSTSPEITCPPNVTIECTDVTLPDNTGLATSVDNCDNAPIVTYSDLTSSLPSCAQEYLITRTWLATDACGNASTCDQLITIEDSTPPTILCPVDVTIECTDSTLPAETGEASATDNCDNNPAITYLDDITGGGCPQEYTIARTWTATDACGNLTTCTQILVVIDGTAPVITCPANVTIECTESTLPENTGSATALDNCDTTPDIAFSDVTMTSPTCIQEYTITRTWTATDACGNSSTCVQTIIVDDSTSPVITCPANVTIECTENTLPENTGEATASDNCDAVPDITFSDVTTSSPECAQEYSITRTWMATDDCGNTSTCEQIITIDDSTPPVITCPVDVTIECTDSTLPAQTGEATAIDNCDPAPSVTYTDITTSSPSCSQEYSITRTWTATDACGNEISCEQEITIVDTTVPDITCPDDITIECLDSTLPENTGTASATDNCDNNPGVEYADVTLDDPDSDGYFIERTWTATDACGNLSTCLQNITVTNPLDPGILGLAFDTICSGGIIIFEGEDPGIDPLSYDWEFGSGSNPSVGSGIGPHNVAYQYNATNGSEGAWVILTLGTPGCMSVTDTVSNIHVNVIPDASFTSPTGNPCVLQDKTFEATEPEVPGYSYEWNFGVGASIPTASTYGPHTVEYYSNGVKTVRLIVFSNEEGASCGDTTTLVFAVNFCPGNITGKVVTSADVPIAGVNIRLYKDQNLDGMQDDNSAVRSVFTNSQGLYSMAALLPGYYVIVQVQPTGYISLYDEDASEDMDSVSNLNPNDNIIPVTVEALELDADNNFVEVTDPGSITGYVFNDFDSDQNPDPAEGIPNVTIELHKDTNLDGTADVDAFVSSVLTTNEGYYAFPVVATGSYVLVEIHPLGYTSVKDIDVSNDGDIVPNTNMTNDTIPLTITNSEVDAGNYFIEGSSCSGLVTTLQDDVPGSLRYMIDCAEDGDTISFHPILADQELTLSVGRLEIDKNLFIISTLSPRITIKSNVSGGIKVFAGKEVEFKNMNIISGLTGYPGAAFDNYGFLTLWDVHVLRNIFLPGTDYLIFNGAAAEMTVKGEMQIETD